MKRREKHKKYKIRIEPKDQFTQIWKERPDKRRLAEFLGISYTHASNISSGRRSLPKRLTQKVRKVYLQTWVERAKITRAVKKDWRHSLDLLKELKYTKKISESTYYRHRRQFFEWIKAKDFTSVSSEIRRLAERQNMTFQDIFDILYPERRG